MRGAPAGLLYPSCVSIQGMNEQDKADAAAQTVKSKCIPFILTLVIIALDQISKFLIVSFIPPYTVGAEFWGGFLRIIHVYNPGAAFSLGAGLGDSLRSLLLSYLPLIVLIVVVVVYFRNTDFSPFQRWAICGVLGGGLGNLIDRFFRPEGVVDFIDVKFYGLFGLERWPTFNIADMSICICAALLIISFSPALRRGDRSVEKT